MRLLLLLVAAAFSVAAQTFPAPASAFHYAGWVRGCTNDTANVLYLDNCVPTNQKPIGTFEPTACEWYTDPNTGVPVRVTTLTNNYLAYSNQTPFSYRNKYMLLSYMAGGSANIFNRATCAFIRQAPASGVGMSLWSSRDDEALYFTSGNLLRRHLVTRNNNTTLATFNGTGGRQNFTSITLDGTSEMSGDGWMVFRAPTETNGSVVSENDPTFTAYCVDYTIALGASPGAVDFAHITPGIDSISGKRYLMIQTTGANTTSLWSFTDASPTPTFICIIEHPVSGSGNHNGTWTTGEAALASPHAVMGQTRDGRQFYFAMDLKGGGSMPWIGVALLHYEGAAFGTEAGGGGVRDIFRMGSYQGPIHFSCARQAPMCVVSGLPPAGARPVADTTTPIGTGLSSRLIHVVENAGEKITVVGTTMSEYFSGISFETYFQHPFGAISMDGSLIAFQSTWGRPNNIEVAIMDWKRDEKNIRVTGRSAAQRGTLRYVAPNASACTVTVSVNANLSSPVISADSDGGGHVERAYSLSALSATTRYYARVICNSINADSSFFTQ